MNALIEWLSHGCLLTLAIALALHLAPSMNAATRFVVWCLTLITVLLLPLAPALTWMWDAVGGPSQLSSRPPTMDTPWITLAPPPAWVLASAAGVWLGATLLGLGRVSSGVRALARLKQRSTRLPSSVTRSFHLWHERAPRSRPATVSSSPHFNGACALGLTRHPTILISDRLLTSLSPDALDLIVLHEQVHLDRRDDWTRLVQSCVLAVTGLHPAVRYISACMDTERECACDDEVVAHVGDPRRYAACLADAADAIAGHQGLVASWVVPNAGAGSLLTRIRRLLDGHGGRRTSLQMPAVGLFASALVAGLMVASHAGAWVRIGPFVPGALPDASHALESGDNVPAGLVSGLPATVTLSPPLTVVAGFGKTARRRPPSTSRVIAPLEAAEMPGVNPVALGPPVELELSAVELDVLPLPAEAIVLNTSFIPIAGNVRKIEKPRQNGWFAAGSSIHRAGLIVGSYFGRTGKAMAERF